MKHIELPESGAIALSLSGGGSKGAYGAGMLKALLQKVDYQRIRLICGTSTGALMGASIAAMVATKNKAHLTNLVRLYETVTDPDILRPNHDMAYRFFGMFGVFAASWAFGGNSIFNTNPLEKLVDKCIAPNEWEAIVEAGKWDEPFEVGFCTVNLQTAQSELITNRTHPDPKILREALFASCNQPVFMKPKQIFKNTKHQYVDGGLLDFNPIEKLFTSDIYGDIEAVLAISMNTLVDDEAPGIGYDSAQFKEIGAVAIRTIKIMVESVYDTDIKTAQLYNVLLKMREVLGHNEWQKLVDGMPKYMRQFVAEHLQNKRYVPIYHIAPLKHVPMDSLKFHQPDMRNLVQMGYDEGSKIFV